MGEGSFEQARLGANGQGNEGRSNLLFAYSQSK